MMSWESTRRPHVITLILLFFAADTFGAGFQLNEHSVAELGRAFSGYGISGDDASAIFYNPATMTLSQSPQIQIAATVINTSASFVNSGSSQTFVLSQQPLITVSQPSGGRNDNGGTTAAVPSLFFIKPLSRRLYLGVGVTAPFGLKTEYDRDWVGRYHALESELITIDINPSIAYRLTQNLSIGAGISAQYAEATLSRAVFRFDPTTGQQLSDGFAEAKGDDWAVGWNFGLLYESKSRARIGLSYRSKVAHTLTGSRRLEGVPGARPNIGITAATDLPESIYLAGQLSFGERWTVTAGTRWTRWSRFDELRIRFDDGSPDDVTPELWENSWTGSIAANFRINSSWDVRAGYSTDESPVPGAGSRTPRIPDADRQWATIGLTYHAGPDWRLDLGFAHLFVDDARLTNTIDLVPSNIVPSGTFTDTLTGAFGDSSADIVGAQFVYNFGPTRTGVK